MVDTLNSVTSVEPPRPVTPLGILTEHLTAAMQLLTQETTVSAELKSQIQQAWKLAAGLDPYVEACTTPESPELATIATATQQENWNQRFSDGTPIDT